MSEERGTLRKIAWLDVFPWMRLTRALRLAVQSRLLLLSTLALLLTIVGWWGIAQLFSGTNDERLKNWLAAYALCPWTADDAIDMHATPQPEPVRIEPRGKFSPPTPAIPSQDAIFDTWFNLTGPFRQLFDPLLSMTGLAFLLLCALWVDAVWAFFGGLITRLVSLDIARSERGGMRAAIRFVRKRYYSYFMAPLYPLLGLLLFVLPMALVGLIGRTGGAGLVVLGVVWPLFLLAGLLMTIFVVGVMFGWPLMWPTISTEGSDSFDALSRSYSYVFQRVLYYLFLVVFAAVIGGIGWLLVQYFAFGVVYLTKWAVSWGAGSAVMDPSELAKAPLAAKLIAFWDGVVRLVAMSFAYSYFLSAATIGYYVLRLEVDGTETDEVFVEEQEEKFGLPPLTTDDRGVTKVEDEEPAGN